MEERWEEDHSDENREPPPPTKEEPAEVPRDRMLVIMSFSFVPNCFLHVTCQDRTAMAVSECVGESANEKVRRIKVECKWCWTER